ncbi:hypothetical protein H0E87_003829 [Populus deltoides]|uniref:Uncharacterized protein n=1 Tax=Populus deltoides TaxID=3696 RepID=A0A8T2ZE36_POPDE|nr:hypothetical protein H0E87_003829 [Populus deltoides]
MTLEDFFTLTEMKDGLTAPSRVHELVAVMQKEKHGVLNNVGDSTRQWAAVASTIAATENKDCLDLFVNLNGLLFIDRWLTIAQKFSNETSEGSAVSLVTREYVINQSVDDSTRRELGVCRWHRALIVEF